MQDDPVFLIPEKFKARLRVLFEAGPWTGNVTFHFANGNAALGMDILEKTRANDTGAEKSPKADWPPSGTRPLGKKS